jgi:hypothetical protein
MNNTTKTGILATRALQNLDPETLEYVVEQQEELKPSRAQHSYEAQKFAKHEHNKDRKAKRWN